MDDRRKYTRTLFAAKATLHIDQKIYQTNILDLSLNGALVSAPEGMIGELGQAVNLSLLLSESDIEISMQTLLVHIKEQQLGLKCSHIDLESITHLKRIMELNTGDAELLQRELGQLFVS
ncbi:PilZ domain-containing protein [Shewanella donghaensis]|uniref:PilZ domain-containing protein n=1 Tax=Shewanella donghaensis TaxID=238836 RepID=UPI0011841FC4|nr:PilZ domain-containing protein [Shewanella donghaensis]